MTNSAVQAVPRARIVRDAHARAVELGVSDIAAALQAQLGQALLGVIVNKNVRTLTRWANAAVRPPQASEQLLRDTFQVVELLTSAESADVARAWFMGMNPQLDDESPAEALSAGRARDVMAAARAFINVG
jgi:hypothetical protein